MRICICCADTDVAALSVTSCVILSEAKNLPVQPAAPRSFSAAPLRCFSTWRSSLWHPTPRTRPLRSLSCASIDCHSIHFADFVKHPLCYVICNSRVNLLKLKGELVMVDSLWTRKVRDAWCELVSHVQRQLYCRWLATPSSERKAVSCLPAVQLLKNVGSELQNYSPFVAGPFP